MPPVAARPVKAVPAKAPAQPAKKSPAAAGSKSSAIAAQVSKWTPQQRIADWKKNGVKGMSFKAWFGDWQSDPQNASKVVDEAGSPKDTDHLKIVYHGTRTSFTHFEKETNDMTELGNGFYFAEDKAMAKEYANMRWRGGGKGRIIAAYLSIRKPFDFDKQVSGKEMNAILAAVSTKDPRAAKKLEGSFRKLTRDGSAHGGSVWSVLKDALTAKLELGDMSNGGVNEILEEAGFDGVGYTAKDELGSAVFKPKEIGEYGKVWIAFSPEQIKATDNQGTFDDKNPKLKESQQGTGADVLEDWTPYHGERDGKGWINPVTGEVRYQVESPGKEEKSAPGQNPAKIATSPANTTPEKPHQVVFVSPSMDDIKLPEAVKRMHSKRQLEMAQDFARLDAMLGLDVTVENAVGAWVDGAENATVTKYDQPMDFERLCAIAAIKGDIARQKAVLAFQDDDQGPDVLMEIPLATTDFGQINKRLLELGVENHTLLPQGDGVVVYAYASGAPDKADETKRVIAGMKTFAGESHVGIDITKGTGQFLGDPNWSDRDAAKANYESRITGAAERSHLSPKVIAEWRRLRDYWHETGPGPKGAESAARRQAGQRGSATGQAGTVAEAYDESEHPRGEGGQWTTKGHAQLTSPEFKQWFGDWEADKSRASQVVDKDGAPLRLYHGTSADFDTFGSRRDPLSAIGWHYFSDNPEFAVKFAGSDESLDFNVAPEVPKAELPSPDTTITIQERQPDKSYAAREVPAYKLKLPGLLAAAIADDVVTVTHAKSGMALTGRVSLKQAKWLTTKLSQFGVDWSQDAESMMSGIPTEVKQEIGRLSVEATRRTFKDEEHAAANVNQIDPVTLQWKQDTIGVGSQVMPVYLNLRKPLDLTELKARKPSLKQFVALLNEKGIAMTMRDFPFSGRDLYQMLNDADVAEKMRRLAMRAGYDGIVFKDFYDPKTKGTSYIAFRPDQVKSASGNIGTFHGDKITESASQPPQGTS